MPVTLPIADDPTVRREVRHLLTAHRWPIVFLTLAHAAAVAAGLVAPWLLGVLVDRVAGGTRPRRWTGSPSRSPPACWLRP